MSLDIFKGSLAFILSLIRLLLVTKFSVFVEICFVSQYVFYIKEASIDFWEECVLCAICVNYPVGVC